MECSICYSEITSATGKVELSCSHPFHFSCIVKWFDKQRLQQCSESCPLCRHDTTDFEKMPDVLLQEDEGSDEDSEVADDAHVTDEQAAAHEDAVSRMRRESDEVGDAITGPGGVWRKSRYGHWIMISDTGGSGRT